MTARDLIGYGGKPPAWTLPNGARVLFVENRALPMLDVSVDFPAGSSRDDPATSGLAGMTVALMRLGTQSLDEAKIAAELADVGAQIRDGNRSIIGVRIESHIEAGNQAIPKDLSQLRYGCSVTDGCVDWATTERMLRDLAGTCDQALRKRIEVS